MFAALFTHFLFLRFLMRILLTGGAGYIGSHTALALLQTGHEIVLLDNFCNSHPKILDTLEEITGIKLPFVEGDVRNRDLVETVLRDHTIEAVIHFAALKAVGESVAQPLVYYDNNVVGTLRLVEAMMGAQIHTLVFSSSATVYGEPQYLPLDENHPTGATNPYGRTKLIVEEMLSDLAATDPAWRIAVLRYFNPVGADESGLIGEDPNGIPNNLMPFITRVAAGLLPELTVFGNDYPTTDGTGVRDYIHVTDLAAGHVAALEKISRDDAGMSIWNLGTGTGYSVLDMVHSFSEVNGVTVPYRIADRRSGDVASCYACADKAKNELGWEAHLKLPQMCSSAWQFENLLRGRNVHG